MNNTYEIEEVRGQESGAANITGSGRCQCCPQQDAAVRQETGSASGGGAQCREEQV
jgi:hypothetical protein